MRQSLLLGKTRKEGVKDETSINADLLTRAGFIEKLMAGVYTFLPLGQRVLSRIENIVREEMLSIGSQEISMPALHPADIWAATGRLEAVDVLFKLQSRHGDRALVLGPSHEEVVTPLVKKFVQSYKDLPVSVFQIQTKFRDEPRARSGLLRGREFRMKDMYSFHASQEDLDQYYELARKAYERIYARIGLGEQTYLTFSSGSSFSKYSYEFQTLAPNGEDTIYVCRERKLAVNRDIFEEVRNSDEYRGYEFTEERAIEVGNIFKLGTRFASAFGLDFAADTGETNTTVMGCYGLGSSRVMGTLVEVYHDEKGIIWPSTMAPYQVHLLALGKEERVIAATEQQYAQLGSQGIEVLYDDRTNLSTGVRLNDCDLIGIPIRVIVSERSLESSSAEVRLRKDAQAVQLVKLDRLNEYLRAIAHN